MEISAIMMINYLITGTCTSHSQESYKVLSSHLAEVFVTFVTSGTCIGSNIITASALSGLFNRLLIQNVR